MAVIREARYLTPNDIGKMVSIERQIEPGNPESGAVRFGGHLQDLRAESNAFIEGSLCDPEERVEYRLERVYLRFEGQEFAVAPHHPVTIHGSMGS